jgi:2-polyprenyl-3-methyl-5-hydroxy-6-metoxy-1,4-benzoquinol methylase
VTVGGGQLELHDSGAYSPGAPRLFKLALPLLKAFDRQRLNLLLRQVPPPAQLLDVGAGRGRFVMAARQAGYEASGIEPSRRGAAAAMAIGAPVRQMSLEEAQISSESVPAVSLWHVLEHLEDPGSAIARIAGWMAADGVLLIGVPNLASLQARVGGERWYHLDVPRHRTHFTTAGLSALLSAHGLRIIETRHGLLEHNPFGMWQSLLNRLTVHPSYLYNLLKRNAPLKTRDLPISLLGLGLLPVAVAAEWLAGVARRGGTIAVLARRV